LVAVGLAVGEGLAAGEAEPAGAVVAGLALVVADAARLGAGVADGAPVPGEPLAAWPEEPHAATSSAIGIAAAPPMSRTRIICRLLFTETATNTTGMSASMVVRLVTQALPGSAWLVRSS